MPNEQATTTVKTLAPALRGGETVRVLAASDAARFNPFCVPVWISAQDPPPPGRGACLHLLARSGVSMRQGFGQTCAHESLRTIGTAPESR